MATTSTKNQETYVWNTASPGKKFFDGTAGSVIKMGGSDNSFIQVQGLSSGKQSGCGLLIFTGISYTKRDIQVPIVASNNKRFLYIFGENFGSVTISGQCYLGKNGSSTGKAISVVNSFFDKARVSKKKNTISLSIGGGARTKLKAAIHQCDVNPVDANYGIYKFDIVGTIIPNSTGSK